MKKVIFFLTFMLTCAVNICLFAQSNSQEQTVVSISSNDLIVVSDVNKITENSKVKNLNDRATEQLKLADESYTEGVQHLLQSDPSKAIESFKKAFKKQSECCHQK